MGKQGCGHADAHAQARLWQQCLHARARRPGTLRAVLLQRAQRQKQREVSRQSPSMAVPECTQTIGKLRATALC
eukprot:10101156-Alexandrium_andersonii.AAC.1